MINRIQIMSKLLPFLFRHFPRMLGPRTEFDSCGLKALGSTIRTRINDVTPFDRPQIRVLSRYQGN